MSSFILRRLLLLVPTLFMISLISFVIIELPPGDYMTSYIANRMALGDSVRQDEIDALIKQYGLDQPAPVPLHQVAGQRLAGQFRLLLRVAVARQRSDLGSSGLDGGGRFRCADVFLGHRACGRRTLRRLPVFDRGLYLHRPQFHRPGHAQLSARTDHDVGRLPLFRLQHLRPLLTGVH